MVRYNVDFTGCVSVVAFSLIFDEKTVKIVKNAIAVSENCGKFGLQCGRE
jgi:hypothetical protein